MIELNKKRRIVRSPKGSGKMKLASIFTSGMVLQKGKPIRIFGTGAGRGSISAFGESRSFVSEDDSWLVEFEPREYGGPYEICLTLGEENFVLEDVYVGEVWLAGGQSNMELTLFRTEYGIE